MRSTTNRPAIDALDTPGLEKMWEPRRLTTVWVFTACYRHSFTFTFSKVKFFLYRQWRPSGLREFEAPTFSDIRHIDGGKGVSLTRRPLFTPRRFVVLISVRGWVDPMAIVRLEELGKLKKSTSSGTQTGDLPACSIVPEPITLPRVPPLPSLYSLML
jgi:hypothetical protein